MGVATSDTRDRLPIAEAGGMRTAVAAAAISSAMAGLIHVAAARNHEGDTVLLWMFVLCAAAQLVWGGVVATRPTRRVLLAGVVLNGGAVIVWALTRTVGIPAIDALSEVEAVGRQDLGAAMFAAVSVASALLVLLRPSGSRVLTLPWVAALGTFALVAALPSLSAAHVHEHGHGHHGHDELAAGAHGDHEHGDEEAAGEHDHEDSTGHDHESGDSTDGHDHGDGDSEHHDGGSTDGHAHEGELVGAGGHEHSGTDGSHGTDGTGGHDHPTDPGTPDDGHGHPTDPTDPGTPDDGHGHPTDPVDPEEPIISLDDPRLTPDQFAAALELIVGTTSAMRGYLTEEDIVAAGYVSIGDGGQPGTYTHFVNWSYLSDAYELDPAHIESIVMKMNADGTSRVVSGMYILSLGQTMADVPDIAGSLTTWHDHDNLCFSGTQLVDIADNGVCEQGALVNTPPMLHVWVEANPCGPFAAIDEHGDVCDAPHDPH